MTEAKDQKSVENLFKGESSFAEQYFNNAFFIEHLRKHSNKIEQILAYVQRLKSQLTIKEKLIQQLKRRQSDFKIDMLHNEEAIKVDFQGKTHIMMIKLADIQQCNRKLMAENSALKARVEQDYSNPQIGRVRYIHSQQIDRLSKDLESAKGCIEKWKQKYNSCKEQCIFLHSELQNQRKLNKQLQMLANKTQSRHGFSLQQHQMRQNKVASQLANALKEKSVLQEKNKRLEQHLFSLENQLSIQVSLHENEVKDILAKISKIQGSELLWKHRYFQLQSMVNHIEGIRANWRIQKSLEDKIIPANFCQISEGYSPLVNQNMDTSLKQNILARTHSQKSKKVER